jgi:hypothetical protein
MNIQFNMLCTTIMNGILGEVDSRYVVAVQHSSLGNLEVQLTKKLSKPTSFSNNVHNNTYSASTLEREMVGCLLEDQERRESPR